jgi:hypothetical protein
MRIGTIFIALLFFVILFFIFLIIYLINKNTLDLIISIICFIFATIFIFLGRREYGKK